jgi:hypothetical protein
MRSRCTTHYEDKYVVTRNNLTAKIYSVRKHVYARPNFCILYQMIIGNKPFIATSRIKKPVPVRLLPFDEVQLILIVLYTSLWANSRFDISCGVRIDDDINSALFVHILLF